MLRSYLVQQITIRRFIEKDRRANFSQDNCSLGSLRDRRIDRLFDLAPNRVRSLELQFHRTGRLNLQVNVRVVDARNHRATSKIDLFGVWTSESPDLVRFAGGNNAFTANGKGLHVWMRDIAGKEFPVKQN